MNSSVQLQAALGAANVVVLGDSVSPDGKLLESLRRMGVASVLMTAARQAAGLHRFTGRFFSCSPADKARLVRKLKEEGNRVAFFGLGGLDQWGMQSADVQVDCQVLLSNFGILPA